MLMIMIMIVIMIVIMIMIMIMIIIIITILSFAVVLASFTHAGVFLFAIIIYQWDQNMEQSFKNGVAAAAMKYCATAQCYPNQSRWMVLFIYLFIYLFFVRHEWTLKSITG